MFAFEKLLREEICAGVCLKQDSDVIVADCRKDLPEPPALHYSRRALYEVSASRAAVTVRDMVHYCCMPILLHFGSGPTWCKLDVLPLTVENITKESRTEHKTVETGRDPFCGPVTISSFGDAMNADLLHCVLLTCLLLDANECWRAALNECDRADLSLIVAAPEPEHDFCARVFHLLTLPTLCERVNLRSLESRQEICERLIYWLADCVFCDDLYDIRALVISLINCIIELSMENSDVVQYLHSCHCPERDPSLCQRAGVTIDCLSARVIKSIMHDYE